MQVFVTVRPENGRYVARLSDSDQYKADGDTAAAAVATLRREVERLVRGGELVFLDVPAVPIAQPAIEPLNPEYREHMREIVAEIYRARDEEKAREFPE
jgi:methionine synthase II (cobalamin-independent)